MRFKTIVRHINLLNLVLLAAITVFALYILPPLLDAKVKYTPPAAKKIAEEKEEKAVETHTPSSIEYTIIAEQNLFHPERKIPPEKKEAEPLPKPEFVLYGTIVAGDISMAFIEDKKTPYTTPGRGKRQKALRVGGTVGGYTLSEVQNDRVIMARGEERIEVKVLDTAKERVYDGGTVTTAGSPPGAVAPGRAVIPPGAVTPGQAPVPFGGRRRNVQIPPGVQPLPVPPGTTPQTVTPQSAPQSQPVTPRRGFGLFRGANKY